MLEIFNEDCMKLMSRYPDKHFDLCICDPPYGGGSHEQHNHKGTIPLRFGGRFDKYREARVDSADDSTNTEIVKKKKKKKNDSRHRRTIRKIRPAGGGCAKKATGGGGGACRTGGTWASKYGADINEWDVAPPPEYFSELERVSKRRIICGGNYFGLPPNRNFIIWRKLTISENFSMAMAEYLWTDIPGNAKVFDFAPQDKNRFHPTQKPVQLYKWLLSKYAKPGYKILDTHLGSGTHAVACADMGFDLVACEIDEFYYLNSLKMIGETISQGVLFSPSGDVLDSHPELF